MAFSKIYFVMGRQICYPTLCYIRVNCSSLQSKADDSVSQHLVWSFLDILCDHLCRSRSLFRSVFWHLFLLKLDLPLTTHPSLISLIRRHACYIDVDLELRTCTLSYSCKTPDLLLWSSIPLSHTTRITSVCTSNHATISPVHHPWQSMRISFPLGTPGMSPNSQFLFIGWFLVDLIVVFWKWVKVHVHFAHQIAQ